MFRLRWLDPEPDDPSKPVDWHYPALIIATLFLNFYFWLAHGLDLWGPGSPLRNAGVLGAGTLLVTSLFFLGPALATQAVRRPLLDVAERSLGSIPAFGLRLCCVLFLVGWISSLVSWTWLWWIDDILRRNISSSASGLIAAGVLVFLFITGIQTPRTSAKMALFTNKLGIALLIAALLRVREGWPAVLEGFPESSGRSGIPFLWHGLALLSYYVAPLAFLAADFGYRSRGRKQVAMIGLLGLVLPLFGTLLLVGVIAVATFNSFFYQPSLDPSVSMALWGKAARSCLPGPMMVAAIGRFGSVRFGARALTESLSRLVPGRRLRWVLLGSLIGVIAWVSIHDYRKFWLLPDLAGTCLAVAAAVLTADFLAGRWRVTRVRIVDWVGLAALLAGCASPIYLPPWMVGAGADMWWHPWFLSSYAVGFLVCLFGRAVERLYFAPRSENAPRPPGL